MGREARCTGKFGSERGEGKALLETNEIIFRGPFRVVVPLKEISGLESRGSDLQIRFGSKSLSLGLGAEEAAKWIKAIREPKSVLDKLGVKAEQRVALVGLEDDTFREQLRKRAATLVSSAKGEIDHLFFVVSSVDDLAQMKKLKGVLKANGALWLLRPKGRKDLSEAQTRAAGKAAGLVDVKVVAFSEALSAEKYVIPVKDRR